MKSIAPITPYGYTIFCDDVRPETGGKMSYMGIYRGKLIFSKPLPAALPKLSLVIHYFERPDESTEPVNLHVYMPGDAEGAPSVTQELPLDDARSQTLEPQTPNYDPLISVFAHLAVTPFNVESEGDIRVRAYRGDLEIRLGTLTVISGSTEEPAPKEAPPTTKKSKPKKATARKRARSKKSS